ncbi:hypothetical protein GLOIN_2v1776328 [Rhizophagus clarus]|uniref:Uncharacterized protein n=1 Tax=Rhizophagus clarus TaxID=94130 RepID=A0A8H3L8J7_9GLOM|nr:hypothetical protein GLOIN_2v1776328 [Rhizophagus clarus]
MANLVAKIEELLVCDTLDALCGASVVYLTIEDNVLPPYNKVRELVDRAVNSSLMKIDNLERRTKVLEILPQMENGYRSIVGLKAIKALNTLQEASLDYTREEIDQNIRVLKSKLSSPLTESDASLYDSIKKNLESIESDLTWRDPEASTVLSDESPLVQNLKTRQKRHFLEPRERMKCELPREIISKCEEFTNNFHRGQTSNNFRNAVHDKTWKETGPELEKRTEQILSILAEIWNNPAFTTSESRSKQSEGTYVTDIIVPLLRATLGDLPSGYICLSTAERQSLASKARKNAGTDKERMGKKPDVMVLDQYVDKIIELTYVECSRIVCSATKKANDEVKLWRETLDGASFVNIACRPTSSQFGIVGIQVAGTTIYLNRVKSLVRLLLTLRNILIVNKSLLARALEQAISNPPQNVHPSPTVSTPPYNNN